MVAALSSPVVNPVSPVSSVVTFVPSHLQAKVFDTLQFGARNFVVSAVAGSGKTTTIEQGLALLDPGILARTWVCAFNAAIAAELKARQVAGRFPARVTISTFHSAGLQILRRHHDVRGNDYLSNLKYYRISEAAWDLEHRLGRIPKPNRKDENFKLAQKAGLTLVGLCQSTLSEPTRVNLMEIAAHYEVELPGNGYLEPLHTVVGRVLEWGRHGMPDPDRSGKRYKPDQNIAFSDMLWLPTVDPTIERPKYQLILVDEAQDLNRCQLEFALSCLAPGGRIGFVGDRAQAIYGFAGADCRSIDHIIERTQAQELPLSISYRCPRRVVALAAKLFPQIEPAPTAQDGMVAWSNQKEILQAAATAWETDRDPWLIMCRMNAPLLAAACALIRRRIPVYIRGRDFADQLLSDVDTVASMDTYTDAALMDHIGIYESRRMEQFRESDASDATIDAFCDRLQCIRIVADELITRRGSTTAQDVKDTLNRLIPEKPNGGVVFSSIHRAKGLEANVAVILRADLLPHPRVVKGGSTWQLEQERNLAYVAITRAKNQLWVDGEFGFAALGGKVKCR